MDGRRPASAVVAGRRRAGRRADAASRCCSGCSVRSRGRACTWVLIERTYRRDPRALTALMIAAFAGKMVFFGAYVAVMLRVVGAAAGAVRGRASRVTSSRLYLIEALYLRRLFAGSRGAITHRCCVQEVTSRSTRREAADGAAEKFDAGKTIIEHVSNSGLDHPLIHLPTHARHRLLGHQARADAVAGRGHRLRRRHVRRSGAT